ncbi:hypothetical protein ASZ78_013889 [Callipepla squamata]|uniref:cAMP-specific 3',5'-cyclic phosphodiesterase 4B n=1 Tax=Callipepla squamata TaxID=9009 RepID=A0A226NGU9_CALSU|nr:hypothetical protein ASZ78_013889 [Callipepla squamata]
MPWRQTVGKNALDYLECGLSKSYSTSSHALGIDLWRGRRCCSGNLQLPPLSQRQTEKVKTPDRDIVCRPTTLPLLAPPSIAITTYQDWEGNEWAEMPLKERIPPQSSVDIQSCEDKPIDEKEKSTKPDHIHLSEPPELFSNTAPLTIPQPIAALCFGQKSRALIRTLGSLTLLFIGSCYLWSEECPG